MAASCESEVPGTQVKIHAQDEVKQPEVKICVLKFGSVYQYTIPSFSVIHLTLRHAEIQVEENNDALLLDVFFRNDSSLNACHLPSVMTVGEACLVEVGLFVP